MCRAWLAHLSCFTGLGIEPVSEVKRRLRVDFELRPDLGRTQRQHGLRFGEFGGVGDPDIDDDVLRREILPEFVDLSQIHEVDDAMHDLSGRAGGGGGGGGGLCLGLELRCRCREDVATSADDDDRGGRGLHKCSCDGQADAGAAAGDQDDFSGLAQFGLQRRYGGICLSVGALGHIGCGQ